MQMAKEFQAALDAGDFRLTTSSRGSARISLPSSKILRAGLTSIRVLRRMVPWGVLSITPRLRPVRGCCLPHRIAEGVGRHGRGLVS